MILVRAILKGIADDRALDGHLLVASPLRDLVEQYNKIALHNDHLPKIIALSTGLQLKEAIHQLDPEEQVALLHKYSVATKSLDTPDEYSDESLKTDIKQFRLFAAKALLVLIILITFIMIGATIAIAVKGGTLPNDGVLKTIVSTAGEIIKVIFSTPTK
jgi:hypothetical protein